MPLYSFETAAASRCGAIACGHACDSARPSFGDGQGGAGQPVLEVATLSVLASLYAYRFREELIAPVPWDDELKNKTKIRKMFDGTGRTARANTS